MKKAKKGLIAVFVIGATIFLSGVGVLIYAIVAGFSPVRILLDESVTYQAFDGFGASGAWTFQLIGRNDVNANEAARLLYSDEGLMFNTLRYNIGAGTVEVDDERLFPERKTESFFIAERFTGDKAAFKDPNNFDFEGRDQNAMNVLRAAIATGNVKHIELFSNSPHYLLTANGKGASTKPHENNLPAENYEAYADYLLTIAGYFFRTYGAEIEISLSPVNEPQWSWGGNEEQAHNQEGCHFDPVPLGEFYDVFMRKLKEYNATNGTNIKPDLFDSGTFTADALSNAFSSGHFRDYIKEFEKYDWFDELEHISVHSYHADDMINVRKNFVKYAEDHFANKQIHMSEVCLMLDGTDRSIDMGLKSADLMLKDLTELGASRWCWWTAIAELEFEDGLIYFDKKDLKRNKPIEFVTTKRYFCFAQFTRYIKEGVRVKSKTKFDDTNWDEIGSCAFKNEDGTVALVVINYANRSRKLRLPSGYEVVEASCTDASRNIESISDFGKLSKKSVTTFVLKKIG